MEVKLVKIPADLHQVLKIRSAVSGEKIERIAARAIRKELDRMERSAKKREVVLAKERA